MRINMKLASEISAWTCRGRVAGIFAAATAWLFLVGGAIGSQGSALGQESASKDSGEDGTSSKSKDKPKESLDDELLKDLQGTSGKDDGEQDPAKKDKESGDESDENGTGNPSPGDQSPEDKEKTPAKPTDKGKGTKKETVGDNSAAAIDAKNKAAKANKKEDSEPAGNPLDDELMKGLTEDQPEDLKSSVDKDTFRRISTKMRDAETLIAENKTSTRTQDLQRDISKELDDLIKELEQQARQQQQQRSSSSRGRPGSQRGKQKQQGKAGQQMEGNSASENAQSPNSTEVLKDRETKREDLKSVQSLIKDVWGHLPERMRQQMMQSHSDKFLPKYEDQIKAYFNSLLKEQQKGSR